MDGHTTATKKFNTEFQKVIYNQPNLNIMNIITGDLLALAKSGEFDAILHGCNCHNTMSAGIAKQIKTQYPEAYAADCQTIAGDINKLGNFTKAITKDGFMIFNCYTQFGFNKGGTEFKDVFEYDSFALILKKLAYQYGTKKFGLPAIGMGLAGGDKNTIMEMIEQFDDVVAEMGGSVTFVVFPS